MNFVTLEKKRRRINMTSLIDMVFLLLIFFMLTTNFIDQRGIEVEVPSALGKKSSWEGAILIRPDKDSVLINTTRVPILELKTALEKVLPNYPATNRVIVQPYKNVPLQTLVSVLDQIRGSGFSSISMIE